MNYVVWESVEQAARAVELLPIIGCHCRCEILFKISRSLASRSRPRLLAWLVVQFQYGRPLH